VLPLASFPALASLATFCSLLQEVPPTPPLLNNPVQPSPPQPRSGVCALDGVGSSSNEPDGGGSSGDEEVGSPGEEDDGGGLDWEDEGSIGGRRDATVGKKVMIRANRFLVNVGVCVCVSLGYGCVLMT